MPNRIKLFLRPILVYLIGLFKVNKGDLSYYDSFDYWQNNGFHIIPNHYYHPIPDTSQLGNRDFAKKSLIGIKTNDRVQLETLKKLSKFGREYKLFKKYSKKINTQIDPNFYFDNLAFDGIDALVYYGMIRNLRPKKILEIGSGWSTKIAASACLKNEEIKLVSIEPYPQPILVKGFPGFSMLIRKRVENVPLNIFKSLESGDILFIDSSHVSRVGGDVNYIFFEILPVLKKGVYVHIHDIFLPFDYPRDWILKEHRFWSEQYLLHAFLMFNDSFEIIFARGYMNDKYPDKVSKAFPAFAPIGGGSFWMKKTG